VAGNCRPIDKFFEVRRNGEDALDEGKGVGCLLHTCRQQRDIAPFAWSQDAPVIDAGRQIGRQDGHSAGFAAPAANDAPELFDGSSGSLSRPVRALKMTRSSSVIHPACATL
jgi:hypothetical protein